MNSGNDGTSNEVQLGSFYEHISVRYGTQVALKLKGFSKKREKLAHCEARIWFLQQCKRKGIFPKHIVSNIECVFNLIVEDTPFRRDAEKLMERFKKKILKLEVQTTYWRRNKLRKEIHFLRQDVQKTFEDLNASTTCSDFLRKEEVIQHRVCGQRRRGVETKLQQLSRETSLRNNTNKSAFLTNVSDVVIPENVTNLLALGPKFVLPTKKIPTLQLIADVESVVRDVEDDAKADQLRAKLVNIMQNGINRPSNLSPSEKLVQSWEKETVQFMRENSSKIVVTNADKGNKTVVMNRADYDEKMAALVNDETVYVKSRDLTSNFQTKNNKLVKELADNLSIPPGIKTRLTTYNSTAPKAYGLPKVHKEGIPLRPVVSFINSPTYALAKFAAGILSPLSVNDLNIKDSLELVKFISEKRLPEGHMLISLDVRSLFTNIPISLVLSEVERRFDELGDHVMLQKEELRQVVELCLCSGYFTYGGQHYLQIEGVAMGSPISPIAADIVMQRTIDKVMADCPLRIDFVKKYVDDLLLSVHADDVDEVLGFFNAFHHKIQFTMEKEVDGCLPYLDLKIHRSPDNLMTTSWYFKSCSSNRIINYNSGHPTSMILNVGQNMVRRARLLTNSPGVDIDQELWRILRINDFPEKVIKKLMRPIVNPATNELTRPQGVAPHYFHSISFVKGISERLKKTILKHVSDTKITLKPVTKNAKFFTKVKDRTPQELKSNVVYKIPCGDCDKCYIGTTKNLLKRRVQEHERSCAPPVRNEQVSALCFHHANNNPKHVFKFEDTSILDTETNYRKRMIKEMLHIRKNMDQVVNKRSDCAGVSAIYSALINP